MATSDKNLPIHGANPKYLYDYYGIDFVENYIDFSTNTNVLKSGVSLTMQDSYIEQYPDPEAKALTTLLSQKLGLASNNLLITNGANEAIYLLAAVFAGKTIGILQPAYSEYEKAFSAYGCRIEYINFVEHSRDECLRVDRHNHRPLHTKKVEQTILRGARQVTCQEYDAIILSNPSNPSGKLLDLKALIDSLGQTFLIVDESYMDFCYHQGMSVLEQVKVNPQVMMIKSFTKIYRMPGLRCGYLLADSHMIKQCKIKQPTWSLSGVIEPYMVDLLKQEDFLNKTRSFYKTEKDYCFQQLNHLKFQVVDSQANFYLLKLWAEDDKIIAFLLKEGIVVRHTKNFPGLDGLYIRIAIRSRQENQRLITKLALCKKLIS